MLFFRLFHKFKQMKIINISIFVLLLISNTITAQDSTPVKHFLNVRLYPKTSEIEVEDSIVFLNEGKKEFLLNSIFTPISKNKKLSITKISKKEKALDVGMDRDNKESIGQVQLTKWQVENANKSFVISYKGIINQALDSGEDYQRGFSQTSGIIDSNGSYLAGSTYWVPIFENSLMVYSLTTELPENWKSVTTGKRTENKITNNKHIDTWVCDKAQEEIFLIAAKFTEYSYDMNSGIKAMAFLRTPDEGLANKYLEVTEQYMEMYQSMLGDYPYSKFALVENFWETGYGMPSFTLLGEKIIRFPFILHSSYPHELLHNWWGNSVYVDFEKGNWCEGITVYMADHLIKEQRGAGEEYRRSTLQKFSNVVTKENDFPLNQFLSRHDEPSSAIGYGKAMMLWHMLRMKLGDEVFLKGVYLFNNDNKYKTASFDDLRIAFETVSKLDLKAFFDQWVNRTGAPEIVIKEIKNDMYGGKYRTNITIEQIQKSEVFNIDVPINIATTEGIDNYVFNMTEKTQTFQIISKSEPTKLVVDPQYDLFRILHPSEVPPTLTKIWASNKNLIILPKKANKAKLEMYQKFAKDWQKNNKEEFEIVFDKDLKELSAENTNWIIGFENNFAENIETKLVNYNSKFTADSVYIDNKGFTKNNNSFVFTLFKTTDINKQNLFVAFDNKEAIAGLIRKLPHYGKYSYLAFNGDAPTNIAKGQWSVLNSPMIKIYDESAQKTSVNTERKALAELKPIFSEKRMMKSIEYLASEELKGRGIGTKEIEIAAKYIAKSFEEAGLKPLNDDYFQKFSHKFDTKGEIKLSNVVGYIPGTDPKLKDETVVISAHYDHLGLGWPDVRKGNEGKIHYGADDNASGVSILLELAKTMAKSTKSKRTIVFLACTAEEAGLIGSKYYVKHSKDYFKAEIFANINLDTDGSLFDKKLLVLNGNSATEWKFIFMGTDYTTGIKSEVISQDLDASDQVSFIEKGIPAIQLFTGATEHYHRPSDKLETIDGKGLVKVATVSKEVLLYLADREEPMHYTGNAKTEKQSKNHSNKASRKVSTGSVPDFAFKGEGVKLSSVMSGSAGEKAGLKTGDIIIKINKTKTDDLKQYSEELKKFKPGDIIILTIIREDKEKSIKLKLGER